MHSMKKIYRNKKASVHWSAARGDRPRAGYGLSQEPAELRNQLVSEKSLTRDTRCGRAIQEAAQLWTRLLPPGY